MDNITILMNEIEQRIAQLEKDTLIDDSKRVTLIRENKRFLVRCQQLSLPLISSNKAKQKSKDKPKEESFFQSWEKLIKNIKFR